MEDIDFERRVLPMKNKMFRLAIKILGTREDAEEAVQETLIKIWQKRDNIKENSNLEGYAIIVARNHCLDKLKTSYHKHKAVDIENHEFYLDSRTISPQKDAEFKDAAHLIDLIMKDFPERWRMIVQLRDIEGYTNAEVADILGLEENVVKVTLSRTRKKLREILINKYKYNYNEN